MSLNLGNAAIEAIRQLHQMSDTRPLVDAIRQSIADQTNKMMNIALEGEHHARPDMLGYTRALRDLHLAFENAATGVKMNQIDKPGPVPQVRK